LIARMIAEGHYVGCHSWNHPDFTKPVLSHSDMVDQQITPCIEWVQSCSQVEFTTKHFRAPYGNLLEWQAQIISEDLGMKIGFWNVDPSDYVTPGDYDSIWDALQGEFTGNESSSAVILLHEENEFNALNGRGKSVIESIVTTYGPMGAGYEFVTVDECYNECDTIVEDGICKSSSSTHYTLCKWTHQTQYNGCT
jgi:peptidoglycan/xylan/chitin deacetylase (PgdA/CDA1 family)